MNVKDSKYQIAADLENLALLLNNFSFVKNIDVIYAASSQCLYSSTEEEYSYTLNTLDFDIAPMSHTIPTGADFLSVSLGLEIKGSYIHETNLSNPISGLQVDIVCRGSKDSFNDLISAWHLDRHEAKNENGVKEGDNKYYHPMYHFTFGGKNMWGFGMESYGSSLIFPSPRLIHLPLDAVLAIDFVIRNFVPLDQNYELTANEQYQRIIYNSQLRIWRPFLQGIIEHWNYMNPYKISENGNALLYLPNLMRF